jgi:Fibronectin type III domain
MLVLQSFIFLVLAVNLEGSRHRRRDSKTRNFEEILFFFELNDSDGDLGIQLDLHPGTEYEELTIYFPNGKEMLELEAANALSAHGLSDFFFESAEPSFDKVSKAEIFKRFPEGKYKFEATALQGPDLLGTAFLSHDFPDPPKITNPKGGPDSPRTMIDVVSKGLEVTWDPVTNIPIDSYEVIVTNEDDSQKFRSDQRVSKQHTSVRFDKSFFQHSKNYEVEVLARGTNLNQVISIQYFKST